MQTQLFNLTLFEATSMQEEFAAMHRVLKQCADVNIAVGENFLSIMMPDSDKESCDVSLKEILKSEDGFIHLVFTVSLHGGIASYQAFNALRQAITRRGVYCELVDMETNYIVPIDPGLFLGRWGMIKPDVVILLADMGYTSIYYNHNHENFYGIAQNGSVHFLNKYLLKYLVTTKSREISGQRELSYKVADSADEFALKYDKGLIPQSFYSSFGASVKIINECGIDLNAINRKIFVRPFIYELRGDMRAYYTRMGARGEAQLMDKVRKGENLDATIKRVLREELKIADDYVAAAVEKLVEFDRDREGIITPRLRVFIFVNSINDQDWKTRRRFFDQFPASSVGYHEDGRSWISNEELERKKKRIIL